MIRAGDVVTRQDAGEHILVVKGTDGSEHTYPLYASTPTLRQAEAKSILRTITYRWDDAYDATRS